ncbi:DMT family transporter [candidate division KSB1 bacterium]|nr:DMT family transporter [candidate division KSB1 bacterium]MBL7093863.1 DMT family transporter [candidate division KSB1 bacterium]
MNNYIGELAALLTAISWSFTSIFFTIAAKRIGSLNVNKIRLYFASLMLLTAQFVLYGNIIPIHVESNRWLWLGVSGIIGLVLGDSMLLQAFVLIGTRLSMLLMSLVPIISTILAWIFLNETLTPIEILAIILTISGISWVILEKVNKKNESHHSKLRTGILFGLGGAFGQALGLIAAKKGMYGDFPALTATLMRILVASSIFLFYGTIKKLIHPPKITDKLKSALLPIFGGSFFGPFIGIWLSLIAIKYANIGIASTLMALPPIFLLPLTRLIFKEKVSWRSLFGTVVAVGGVAMIFLF